MIAALHAFLLEQYYKNTLKKKGIYYFRQEKIKNNPRLLIRNLLVLIKKVYVNNHADLFTFLKDEINFRYSNMPIRQIKHFIIRIAIVIVIIETLSIIPAIISFKSFL